MGNDENCAEDPTRTDCRLRIAVSKRTAIPTYNQRFAITSTLPVRKPMSTTKVALVTGAGKRRVGWHVADALAARGYKLVVHYRSSAAEATETVAHLQSRGVEAAALQADLADEKAVRGLIDATLQRFGRLDVLVNCAAVWKS